MNVTCPECRLENAYHNGVSYDCPDCGFEWREDESEDYEANNVDQLIADLKEEIAENNEIQADLGSRLKSVLNNGSDMFSSTKLASLIDALKVEKRGLIEEIDRLKNQ